MHISLLGPLQVDGAEGRVVLGAAKERSLLAALALSPGSVVSTDALIGALWGEHAPAAARKTLQTYVWHLRQALGNDTIATEPPGYVLRVDKDDIDVGRFRTLVRDGEDAMRRGAPDRARAKLGEAVALWRGDPFAGVAAHSGLTAEAVRLKEEYLSALELRVAADLAAGAHDELVGELEVLVREHPFRERLWGHLITALYRSGRQADALATYQRARELLAEELGLEPGGELRRLESAILNHDPELGAPPLPASQQAPEAGTIVRSPVRYARCRDGVSVAFQVSGDGPIDVLVVPGFVSHLDIWWNAPTDRLVRRLSSIGRLISFDKRGMGLSDRPDTVEAEQWIDDAVAVLDAAGSRQAVVIGVSAGVPTALLLAARHPERVRALALYGGYARALAGPDYDVGLDPEVVASFARNLESGWGSGVAISWYAPSRAKDPGVRGYWARYQLLSASPTGAMRWFWASINADVREVLSSISVPTLVLHAERDAIVPVGQARYIADRVAGAEFVALDSDVHLMCVSDVIDEMTDEIQSFIGRVTATLEAEPVLVTVLAVHTSSSRARREVEAIVERCGGRVQRPAVTATFDGPGQALRFASTLVHELRAAAIDIGVGIHCGEAVPTDVGHRGSAVDVAHQVAALAGAGEVLLTHTVRDLVGGGRADLEPWGLFERPGDVVPRELFALSPATVDARPA